MAFKTIINKNRRSQKEKKLKILCKNYSTNIIIIYTIARHR